MMGNPSNSSEKLHKNDYGEVVLCGCCENLQLTMGNVMLKMPSKGFYNLQQVLGAMLRDKAFAARLQCPNQKLIIRTPSKHLFISVTPPEFKALVDLIENALLIYEVKLLISGK